jgi:hypothetical protein
MIDNFNFFGWVDDQKSVESIMKELPFPVFGDVWAPIKDTGKGKITLLHEIVEKVAGRFPIRRQTIGDCVSMGAACAVDVIKAVDIHVNKDFEEWVAETATEDIYAGSRVQIGKGRISGDGSIGAWAARYVNEYGALARQKYGNIDLSVYDGNRARQWGSPGRGTPSDLITFSRNHPVQTVSLVKNYEEARDLIANGYCVTVASNFGFTSTRDKDGFARASGQWAHQMCFVSVDDAFSRPGLLCNNSWGASWISGPKRHNQPDGSFWVDADTVNKMFAQGDSWAFSGYKGFEPRELDTRII